MCLHLHTVFHYNPFSRFALSTPVHNKELEHTILFYKSHLESYLWAHFTSVYEGNDIITRITKEITTQKKHLIPGYLTSKASNCINELFSSCRSNDSDEIIPFIDGFLPLMPKDKLRDSIFHIAEQNGIRIIRY